MTGRQIIISIVAVIVIIILFNLPKSVVENEIEETAGQIMQDSDGPSNQAHQASTTTMEDITGLKNQLSSEINEKNLIFADSLAGIYLSMGFPDSAASVAKQLAKKNSSLDALKMSGDIYYRAFNFADTEDRRNEFAENAREIFDQVLEEEPDNFDVQAKVAMTYVSSSNPMKGILMLREIVDADPDNREAIYNLGILSLQSGQYDKAVERFEKLVSLDETDVQANFYLGLSYFENDQMDKAKSAFEKVKSLDSDPTVQSTVDDYLKEINKL